MATIALSSPALAPDHGWKNILLPKEHGSWSLALEPVLLGLLVAPSVAAGWVAVFAVAGFFARRPLKMVWREKSGARRSAALRALLACGGVAAVGVTGAIVSAGVDWLWWLAPFAALGGLFLWFDLQNGGREESAEIAGAGAFAVIPAAMGAAAGLNTIEALAILVAMAGRAVPAVMMVRACVRGGKTGTYRAGPPLIAGAVATGTAVALAAHGVASIVVPVAFALCLARAALRLLKPTPIRARTLGFQELGIGVVYLVAVALTWPA